MGTFSFSELCSSHAWCWRYQGVSHSFGVLGAGGDEGRW